MAGLDPAIQRTVAAMRFLGIDGYRKGWVAVSFEDGRLHIAYPTTIADALRIDHDYAMIDMPIGIPATGYRSCDLLGKRMLSKASSRLFTGARRELFGFASQKAANSWAKEAVKPGVSCQLFCILGKIVEVDSVMSQARQDTVRESHPELVFMRLNAGIPLAANKKTPVGIRQRVDLLEANGLPGVAKMLGARAAYVKSDDVLDACACLIAARDRIARIPDVPEVDERGLRMEIWY